MFDRVPDTAKFPPMLGEDRGCSGCAIEAEDHGSLHRGGPG